MLSDRRKNQKKAFYSGAPLDISTLLPLSKGCKETSNFFLSCPHRGNLKEFICFLLILSPILMKNFVQVTVFNLNFKLFNIFSGWTLWTQISHIVPTLKT